MFGSNSVRAPRFEKILKTRHPAISPKTDYFYLLDCVTLCKQLRLIKPTVRTGTELFHVRKVQYQQHIPFTHHQE